MTPSWISFFGSDTFYSSFARIFERLVQECDMPVVEALKGAVDEFAIVKERSKQCVAAEYFDVDVTGKGKYGTRVPLLRQKIFYALMTPLPPTVVTTVTAKRSDFLAVALIEISPEKMPFAEIQLHHILLNEII
ncbi:hypothetical protein PIB30_110750, partial [Stylosanthes scabra]|nr:hypothetical protein [Stylosanthes scabra]